MMYFSRPYAYLQLALLAGVGVAMAAAPPGAQGQVGSIIQLLQEPSPLLSHSNSQGYLGVLVSDIDNDSAAKLKLKETRGAVITLIDHDAPAGQKGLRVNDVVLEVNGQNIEGAEQFGRMLREIPPGRNVSLVISRDGNVQTIGVELVDRQKMEHDVWNKMNEGGDVLSSPTGMGILGAGGDASLPGFHMPFVGSSLKVGALVEPLTSQMADYLGVPNGVMVKQVARKSEAALAGLKAFDVIVKVGTDSITTTADWDRALRANQGKQVQVTIQRDRRQQTVNLQVDSKHRSDVHYEDLFPVGTSPLVAELTQDFGPEFATDAALAAQSLHDGAEAFKAQIDPKQLQEFEQQAQKLRDSFKAEDFKVDPKQMEEFKRQMKQFGENFKADEFKFDSKQMEDLKRQMEERRKATPHMQLDQEQFDQLKRQMKQMLALGLGNRV
jgi:serine protease Do